MRLKKHLNPFQGYYQTVNLSKAKELYKPNVLFPMEMTASPRPCVLLDNDNNIKTKNMATFFLVSSSFQL